MPDMPNWQEMGKPVADAGDKAATDVYDQRYGKYQPHSHKTSAENPASQLNPQPFASMK